MASEICMVNVGLNEKTISDVRKHGCNRGCGVKCVLPVGTWVGRGKLLLSTASRALESKDWTYDLGVH